MRFLLSILTLCLMGISGAYAQGDLHAAKAYAFATAPAQKNGAVFVTLHNGSDHVMSLEGAESDVAGAIEIHSMAMEGDKMQMRQIQALQIPSQQHVMLEPTGNHIMLIGLKDPLKAGEHFDMTLLFDGDVKVPVSVEIVAPGAKASGHDHHKMDHGDMDHGEMNHDHMGH